MIKIAKKKKGLLGLILSAIPILALFIAGGYLIGSAQAQMIVGWILVIAGGIGVVGWIANLLGLFRLGKK